MNVDGSVDWWRELSASEMGIGRAAGGAFRAVSLELNVRDQAGLKLGDLLTSTS